ncbi:hypothetical protein [Congregibacter sp.]|uniref:hypothetical protein n=1 Tax=Congregibacter sp. TaxID=2744308 RepID=UPI00385C3E9C
MAVSLHSTVHDPYVTPYPQVRDSQTMLLRRVTQHITEQNWFAVVVDFAIVVFGVFVGLQVQEWQSERELLQQETQYLFELRKEVSLNTELLQNRVDVMAQVVTSGERAVAFLDAGRPCEEDCWPVLVDFFAASQVLFSPLRKAVFDEMQRLGLLRATAVKNAVEPFYVLNETIISGLDSSPSYRQMFRKLITVRAHAALWGACHRMNGVSESLQIDCSPGIPNDETIELLERIRAHSEIKDELNYWVGMHYLYSPITLDVVESGKSGVRAIDLELSTR